MKKNEFLLTPAVGRSFVGRRKLLHELSKDLEDEKSRIGFCLYGRRRVGKTSVLMELKHLLRGKKKVVVAYLSLFDMADLSLKTFAEELANSVINAYMEKGILPLQIKAKKLLEAPVEVVVELLKSAKIEANVLQHIRILLEHKETQKNQSEFLRHAFNTGETLGKATGTKCVLILDEFPEMLKIENGLQMVKMLRTQQEIQKNTALVISGSIRKTMETVALSESAPFYRQLVPKHILPFTEQETGEFLKTYLGEADEKKVKRLHELTGGLPFYLQFIGRATNYSENLEEAIGSFIEHEGNLFFKEEFEKLGDKERLILVYLSSGSKKLTEIARGLDEPTTTIGRYMPILMEKDLVDKKSRGTYGISDSLFSYWIRHKYPQHSS